MDPLTSQQRSSALPLSCGELQAQGCTCTPSLTVHRGTYSCLSSCGWTFHAHFWHLGTLRTTLQSKHIHLQFLFSQITPLANVSKIHTHHIWCKPNIFSLLDPSQYLPKVLQRRSRSCDWLKVRVPWLRICLGLTCEQRDTELCDGASCQHCCHGNGACG